MSGFYELKCLDHLGFYAYYYFYSSRPIRNYKTVSYYTPAGMRVVIDNFYHKFVGVKFMHNPLKYIYLKYFKKADTFPIGYRVNWEKAFKKSLDK